MFNTQLQTSFENGLLSYENPNYHMDPQHIERNSHLYDEILSEIHQQRANNHHAKNNELVGRKNYAKLDIGQMGVDLKENFKSPDSDTNKKSFIKDDSSPSEAKTKSDQKPEKKDKINEIRHIKGDMNENDLYALPNKKREEIEELEAEEERAVMCCEDDEEEKGKQEDIECIEDKDANKDLPPGWEKHEDNEGPYYWHIKSGTIQREPPTWPKEQTKELRTPVLPPPNINQYYQHQTSREIKSSFSSTLSSIYGNRDVLSGKDSQCLSSSVTRSNTSFALDQDDERRRKEEMAYKRRSYPLKSESDTRPIRFAVRSLGWVEIAEEDLTPERSSKAVNKCIVDLSLGKNDLLDVVGRWGDGKDLFMDLDEGALKLIDPENLTILNTQPIHTIRVWGVGRDNGRDFAYVARDRTTRIHMCHVFRCDTAARTIANTLRDICKKIMIERTMQSDTSNLSALSALNNFSASSMAAGGIGGRVIRPTDLPTENRRWIRQHRKLHLVSPHLPSVAHSSHSSLLLHSQSKIVAQSFPTPMEEPKKVLKAQYIGATEVLQPTGMDVLNGAIDQLLETVPVEQFENVSVSVAPSMISIVGENGQLFSECRVRYLSFLGIGKNVKNCAFIMHTAQDKFVAHVFNCEPSSGPLCKTIEAACKLRYQKCLDAHPNHPNREYIDDSPNSTKGLGATIKNFVSSFSLKKDKSSS
ncbi:amyloid beta precursor protein binding family B member 1-like isoform X2 [Culicoides brevitarsis]|uniref:amyloid beta precursor protein binding family B member 1-like isoform X2 n=1 Tax=Culicoides brevitarsis TaxID=469753 RepID=UPI00307B3B07